MIGIYCITNLVNNKKYIGKTTEGINIRWKDHCTCARRKNIQNRPLYKAFNKYGIENFKIELIEECSIENLNAREIYWIAKFNTFKCGYNATKGGDGKILYDYAEIVSVYTELKYVTKTAEYFNCDPLVINKALKAYNISTIDHKGETRKAVEQYDLDNNYIQTFSSEKEAALWLYNNKKVPNFKTGIISHIHNVATGKAKTAYKYIWKYIS